MKKTTKKFLENLTPKYDFWMGVIKLLKIILGSLIILMGAVMIIVMLYGLITKGYEFISWLMVVVYAIAIYAGWSLLTD